MQMVISGEIMKQKYEKELIRIAKKYNINYLKQKFNNCFGGYWYVETYSLYNENGCFTIHYLGQRNELDFYITPTISNTREELTQNPVKVTEYEKDFWEEELPKLNVYSLSYGSKFLNLLTKVIELQISKNGSLFGIKIT